MADATGLSVRVPGIGLSVRSLEDRRLRGLGGVYVNRGIPPAGTGYLAGKLTGHDPIIPAQIRILYRHAEQGALGDGYLVALTPVNAVGEWRVENLNLSLRYDVVARREGYNDVITAGVQPLPM